MEGVALDVDRVDLLAAEDLLERSLDRRRPGPGGAGDRDDGMLDRHRGQEFQGSRVTGAGARAWRRAGPHRVGAAVAVVSGDPLDLVLRAEDQRRPHVERLRRDVEDAIEAVDGGSARLFDEHRDRVGLVEQAQPAMLVALARILRIEIDAAADQDPIDVGDDRTDPAHVEVSAARPFVAFEAIVDIGADGRRPMAGIRRVDREFGRSRRDAKIEAGHSERVGVRVERRQRGLLSRS